MTDKKNTALESYKDLLRDHGIASANNYLIGLLAFVHDTSGIQPRHIELIEYAANAIDESDGR